MRLAAILLLPVLLAGSAFIARPNDSVTLRRGPCFGNCPIYEVTLRGDGSASYSGGDYAPRNGRYEGKVDPAAVEALLDRLDEVGFWRLRVDQQLRVTDLPEATLTARRGGRSHRIHTNLTPRTLEPIHAAIDSVAATIEWYPVQPERTRPETE